MFANIRLLNLANHFLAHIRLANIRLNLGLANIRLLNLSVANIMATTTWIWNLHDHANITGHKCLTSIILGLLILGLILEQSCTIGHTSFEFFQTTNFSWIQVFLVVR